MTSSSYLAGIKSISAVQTAVQTAGGDIADNISDSSSQDFNWVSHYDDNYDDNAESSSANVAAAVTISTSNTTLAAVDTSDTPPDDTSGAALSSAPATRAELSQTMTYMRDLIVAQTEYLSRICAHGPDNQSCHFPLPPF